MLASIVAPMAGVVGLLLLIVRFERRQVRELEENIEKINRFQAMCYKPQRPTAVRLANGEEEPSL